MLTEEISKALLLNGLETPEVRHKLRELITSTVEAMLDLHKEEQDGDRLLDLKEAAELVSMTPAALRQAAYRGKVDHQKMGRRLRFSRKALLAWGR
jgi:hypothetical protein